MPETQNTSRRRFRRMALLVAGAIACTALGAVGGAYAQGAFNFQPTESATPQFGKANNVNIPEGSCQTNPLGVTLTEAVNFNSTTDTYEAGPASFVFGPFDAACAGGTF